MHKPNGFELLWGSAFALAVTASCADSHAPKAISKSDTERVGSTSSALVSSAWTSTVSMGVARQNHVAALLTTGSVLVAGGHPGSNVPTSAAEVYSPATGVWTTVGSMGTARRLFGACTLASGKVLVAGGNAGAGDVASAELFDPSTNTWSATGSLAVPREDFSMTCLSDGRVLVAGGSGPSGLLNSAEVYDPTAGTWTSAGTMPAALHTQGAALLNDGRVLVAGGNNASGPVNTAAIWSPSTNAWTATGSMATARAFFALNVLSDGRVLAAGGLVNTLLTTTNTAEIYDPTAGTWSPAAHLNTARYSGVSATLAAGPIIVGGVNGGSPLASSESYDRVHNTWTQVAAAYGAVNQTATALSPTSVVVAGGNTGSAATKNAQMYGVLNGFALYAQRSVTLGSSDHINGGDVGVAGTAPSSFGPQLIVGSSSTMQVNHNLAAPSVSLGSGAHVGDVQTNSLTNAGATLGTLASYPALPLPPLALPTGGGGSNVTVPAFTITTLNPGSYGAVSVTGTLYLNPGSYTFSSVTMADQAHLAGVSGTATVSVTGTFQAGNSVSISSPGSTPAGQLVVSVAGYDSGMTPAFNIGTGAAMSAILSAPHGTLSIGANTLASGAFSAFDLKLGNGVTINFQNGFADSASQHGTQQLSGYITPGLAAAPLVGPVPQNTVLNLAIGLPENNPGGLQSLIQNISDPSNPSFRQYIDAATFASTYGASASSYAELTAFATAHGLSIRDTYPTNLLLTVTGTAAAIESAFFLNLNYYLRPDGTQFFAPDREPSLNLPSSKATVLRISGLNNALLPKSAAQSTGSSPKNNFTGYDLRNAYLGCAGSELTGAGQRIGVTAFGGYNLSDITAFQNANTPSGITPQSPELFLVDLSSPNDANIETTLDIEAIYAMAPAAQVDVFEAPGDGTSSDTVAKTLHRMADVSRGSSHGSVFNLNQMSNSYALDADSNAAQAMDQLAVEGVSFFTASGDSGNYQFASANPTPERYLPWLTVVGGTNLYMSSLGSGDCSNYYTPYGCVYSFEQAWNGTGGGSLNPTVSSVASFWYPKTIPIPSYQKNINPLNTDVSKTYRNYPDVSALAANFAFIYNGQEQPFSGTSYSGTSFSSPIWAGYMALVNERLQNTAGGGKPTTVGFANPALYASFTSYLSPGTFHDVTTEDTWDGCCYVAYTPTTGYDLATGLGSPTCALIDQLASATPGSAADSGLCCSGGQSCRFQAGAPGVCCAKPLVNGTCCPFAQTDVQCCSNYSDVVCGVQCCSPDACAGGVQCCSAGAFAVCGTACCTDLQTCINPNTSTCGDPVTPQAILEDNSGKFLAESGGGTEITVFEGVPYQLAGSGFTAPGQVEVDLNGVRLTSVIFPSPPGSFTALPLNFNSSETGPDSVLSLHDSSGNIVQILIDVEPLPPPM